MQREQSDKILIDRFVTGGLTGIELDEFNQRMESYESFRKAVQFHQVLVSGILLARENELKGKVMANVHYRKNRIPFALKMIVTFLVVTIIGISLWFYVDTDSSGRRQHPLFTFLNSSKTETPERKAEMQKAKSPDADSSRSLQSAASSQDGTMQPGSGDQGESQAGASAEGTGNDTLVGDEDIVIKKDQLLITAALPVNEKPAEQKSQEADPATGTTQNVAEKLNPAAGLPVDERTGSTLLQVEFWVSPVNYRGYKMSKNKLILFGIEEPDAVKLFRLSDNLYMKYGNDFFRLVNTFDFLSYQRLKDADVPLAIRQ